MGLYQTFIPKKNRVLGLGIGLGIIPKPNPKTQKILYPNLKPKPKTQKLLYPTRNLNPKPQNMYTLTQNPKIFWVQTSGLYHHIRYLGISPFKRCLYSMI